MSIPLPDLHQIVTKIEELTAYTQKRRYYNRDRVADEIERLRNQIRLAVSDHTYYDGWLREKDAEHRRQFTGSFRRS